LDYGRVGQKENNIDKVRANLFSREYLRTNWSFGVYWAVVSGVEGKKQKLWLLDPDLLNNQPKFNLLAVPPVLDCNVWFIEVWIRNAYWPPKGLKETEGEDEMANTVVAESLRDINKALLERGNDGGMKTFLEMQRLSDERTRDAQTRNDERFHQMMQMM